MSLLKLFDTVLMDRQVMSGYLVWYHCPNENKKNLPTMSGNEWHTNNGGYKCLVNGKCCL